MAKHLATIDWKSDGNFASGKYSRAHEWRFDGGAVISGSSSPSVVPVPMSDPAAVDPEEALVAAASSCHMLSFLYIAKTAGFQLESYRDEAEGTVGKNEDGRFAITRIVLKPEIVFAGRQPTAEELDELHHKAHEACFIANSVRCEISVAAA